MVTDSNAAFSLIRIKSLFGGAQIKAGTVTCVLKSRYALFFSPKIAFLFKSECLLRHRHTHAETDMERLLIVQYNNLPQRLSARLPLFLGYSSFTRRLSVPPFLP